MIYTFYSYKGGVGRSMAAANVAVLLAKLGKRVLVVDWDLEAPGVERFFEQPRLRNSQFTASHSVLSKSRKETPGIVDLLTALRDGKAIDWRNCILEAQLVHKFTCKVGVISAGQDTGDYAQKVQSLNWEELFSRYELGNYLEILRNEWSSKYDFVLIDSRTGINDIGGICTILFPDILVLLFTTSYQSIDGTADVIRRVNAAREKLPVERMKLLAVPVLGRDESQTEYEASKAWREEIAARLGDFYQDWLPSDVKARDVLQKLYIPYIAYWSFGERLPVVEEKDKIEDPRSIVAAYSRLANLLASELDWTKVNGEASGLTDEKKLKALLRESEQRIQRSTLTFFVLFCMALGVVAALLIFFGAQMAEKTVPPGIISALGGAIGALAAQGYLVILGMETVEWASVQFVRFWIAWLLISAVAGAVVVWLGVTSPSAALVVGSAVALSVITIRDRLKERLKRSDRL
jgi:MinD-like ATPase involved in chromosome partitioning or flagellar assembly